MFKLAPLFALLCILSSFFFCDCKANEKKSKNVIIMIHNETVYCKGFFEFYKTLKDRGHNVKVIAVPYLNKQNEPTVDMDIEFSKKFNASDIQYPCGMQKPYKSCNKLDIEKADYVIVGNPYNTTKSALHPNYTMEGLRQLGNKVIYFVYGPHLFHGLGNSNSDELRNLVDIAMVDSESTRKLFIEQMKFNPENVVVSGYQNYKNVREKTKKFKKDKQFKETILWLPRWSLTTRNREKFEGGSTFLNYYHFICNYAEDNPDIRIIIRPHVFLFTQSIKDGFLSQRDVDQIIQKFRSIKNIVYSEQIHTNLEDDVIEADIVISDGSSALGEVVVADKPIIYLSNGWDNEFNSNDLGKEFKSFIYLAHEPDEIIRHINFIRKTNYTPFAKPNLFLGKTLNKLGISNWNEDPKRVEFKNKLDPIENPAIYLAEYIETH